MKPIIEIKKLTKYYDKTLAVKDLSLTLEQGEIFGLIGPNGAGKSTTIRSIMNLVNKTKGTILINGKEFNKNDIDTKKIIGYLPSEINLYDDYTVKEMLDYHETFYEENLKERRKELVELLKLDENKLIEDLSLGNLKKLGIVLALMHNPKILILDEPTSGLDPIMQNVFYNILLKEKSRGTTILYSTHILSEISRICDRVGIIKEGKLLKVSTIKELNEKHLTFVTLELEKDIEKIIKELNIEPIFIEENTIKFNNYLNPNELIKKLSKYEIRKILIEEAPLEDIFIHYYE